MPALDWGLRVGVAGVYNDNLLRLSGPDQDAFRRYDPGFRTPLETVDDAETEFTLAPSLIWRAPSNLMVNATYRFKAVQRSKNDITNYQTHSLSAAIRPRIKGYRWQVRAGLFTIPSFYLRVYRDRDLGLYDAAKFENWEYTGDVAVRPVESVWLSLLGGFGSNYYNERFTEYDGEYTELGTELRYATPWGPTLSGRYFRRVSENVGKDQSFTTIPADDRGVVEDNEYGDGDFNEDDFRLTLRSPIRVANKDVLDAALSSRIRRRIYTTDRSIELDPFHRGRLDSRWELTPSITWAPLAALDVDLYFTYEQRTTESDVEAVARVKDFVRHEVGLGLTYKIN
ncbi:MAG: hypothetical protein IPK53_16385 [bacterium]|nr:hypothetical protein [bacterium]